MHLCLSLSSASTGTDSNDLKPASKFKKSKISTGRVYEKPTQEDILLRKEQELKSNNSFRQQAERQKEERRRTSAKRRQESLQHLDEQCSELESAVLAPSSDAGSLQHGLNELMKECNVAQTFHQVNASSILSRCMVIQQHIKSTELEIPTAAVAASAKSSSVVTKKKALSQGKRKGPVKKAPVKNDFATFSVDSDDSDYDEPLTKKKSSKKPSRKRGGSSVARGAGSTSQSLTKPSQSNVNDKSKTGGRKKKSAIAKSTKVGDDDAWNCLKCKTANASSRSRCTSCLGWKDGKAVHMIGKSKFVVIFRQPQYQSPYTLTLIDHISQL